VIFEIQKPLHSDFLNSKTVVKIFQTQKKLYSNFSFIQKQLYSDFSKAKTAIYT